MNRSVLRFLPVPIVAPIVVAALLLGVFSGLTRMGVAGLPVVAYAYAGFHGPLMVVMFLATVISVERAKAMAKPWAWLAPILNGIGAVLFIFTSLPRELSALLVLSGNFLLSLTLGIFFFRERALFNATLLLASGLLIVGNALLLTGNPTLWAVPWWMGFLVLTIAGERLELGRLVKIPPLGRALFALLSVVMIAGAGASLDFVFAFSLLGFSIWLLRYDVAMRTIRFPGLPRFIAACLILGNIWLGVGGALSLFFYGWGGGAGPIYDAILHSIFVGFVFSMIFGHAPVILPAVTGLQVPFKRFFYAHFALLHLSLAVRLVGDLAGNLTVRQTGAWGNLLAILLFLALTLGSVLAKRLKKVNRG